jgi:ferredoxin
LSKISKTLRKGEILKDNLILSVRKDLCLGCGLCAGSCPRQAISLPSGQAQIDQDRCNQCGVCTDVCPQGAIVELSPVSKSELEATVTALKNRADDIISRIERMTEPQQ